jgi:hypothetical protein
MRHIRLHAWQEATVDGFYWQRHPDGPFATLIRVATTYLHPEADDLESGQGRYDEAWLESGSRYRPPLPGSRSSAASLSAAGRTATPSLPCCTAT